MRWSPEGDEAAHFAGAFDFLKFTYLRFRPGLELVYGAPLPTSFALILAPAILAVILWCAFRQAVDGRGRRAAEPLIPLLALCWIILVPTGFTFTRIFLPSQFFMVVVLVRATRLPGKVIRTVATAAAVVLVLINFHEALIPTYRLDSVVPYKQIADDVAAISEAEGIETVMASGNSLNVESIARYLRSSSRQPTAARARGNRRRACAARGRAERPAVPLHLAHGGKGRVDRHPPAHPANAAAGSRLRSAAEPPLQRSLEATIHGACGAARCNRCLDRALKARTRTLDPPIPAGVLQHLVRRGRVGRPRMAPPPGGRLQSPNTTVRMLR